MRRVLEMATQSDTYAMELSEYEVMRQRRIEQNQQKLETLHILKIPPQARPTGQKKQKATKDAEPVRRSLRQRQIHENVIEIHEAETEREILRSNPNHRVKRKLPELFDLPVTHFIDQNTTCKGKKQHVSSSQLDIQFKEFHSKFIGTQMLPKGKQTVMQNLCPTGFVAKFSKMSGVQPWKNAIALFVNIDRESRYDNVFHQKDMVDGHKVVYFQWFGQTRWHDESPLVVRLKGMKRGDEKVKFDASYDNAYEKKDEPLLLFLRHLQGPYIYCGRLGYLGHRPASKPLEFRWQLLDLDVLQWEQIRGLLDSFT